MRTRDTREETSSGSLAEVMAVKTGGTEEATRVLHFHVQDKPRCNDM